MKNILPWLTAFLFLGCLALGYLLVRERGVVTEVTVREATAGRQAGDRIAELQNQLAVTKAAAAAAGHPAVRTPPPAADAAPRPPSPGSGGSPRVVHLSDIMKDHPEYAALYAKEVRRGIDHMYGDGLNTLGLAPAQLSQLKNLLAERQMNNVDAQGAAEAAGLERGSPAWQDAMKQAAQETEQQIEAVVGPNANSTLQILQARASLQAQVETSYKSDFADAGVPLSPEQTNAVVQALSDANYTGRDLSTRPPGYNDPDPATGLTSHESRILDAVSRVLSPAQLQIARTDLVENRQSTTIMHEYTGSGGPVMIEP
jgi:hypothetical protein